MTAPYYSDEFVHLYLGDCREITEWLAADVLVTDPPYGMAYQSGSRTKTHDAIIGDDSTDLRDEVLSMWGGAPGIVFGTWRAARPASVRTVAVWDKTDGTGPGMGDLSMPFGSSHEEFYLIGGPWRLIGKRRGSVIRTAISMGGPGFVTKTGHPTAKPISLMEQLVMTTEGIVADPFAGSGSTLVAAKMLGRKAIGVEIEEKYCEIAARRLLQDALPFGEPA